ncbi:MAG TPA: H(+)/Cl(-) exchange transporter ClcA [Alloacidobacterium sp.]|nr:H(+)/Cl(-) exchange transporter ClcA [Alloacidobacterium sp.]
MMLLNSRIIRISIASLVTGLLIGVVGGLFRLSLIVAEQLREELLARTHVWPHIGWLASVAMGLTGAAVARLMVVRLAPQAEGSGLQRVEAIFSREVPADGASVVLVKFFGGVLAIGSGLALGREGPTVHMGSSLAALVSRFLLKDNDDDRALNAAGAGAGLAVAFNAPLGGSIFVFEELTSSFSPWLMLATLAAAAMAVWVVRAMLGNHFEFTVERVSVTDAWKIWPFLLLGGLMGAIGAFYNRIIVVLLRFMDRSFRLTSVQWAAAIGATIGLAAWFKPALVGGGDDLTQSILSGRVAIGSLAIVFILRFFIGPLSYAARTPGGLFAPMLVLGASFGALFGEVINHLSPNVGVTAVACAVVGMGTFFSACVRAPLTGIVLTVEMTGRGDLTLSLLSASLAAMVVAMLLNSQPIYETLKHRMLERQTIAPQKITQAR